MSLALLKWVCWLLINSWNFQSRSPSRLNTASVCPLRLIIICVHWCRSEETRRFSIGESINPFHWSNINFINWKWKIFGKHYRRKQFKSERNSTRKQEENKQRENSNPAINSQQSTHSMDTAQIQSHPIQPIWSSRLVQFTIEIVKAMSECVADGGVWFDCLLRLTFGQWNSRLQ